MLAELEEEEPAGSHPADDDVDIINDADAGDQAPAKKNRKAAVVESDEEDEERHRDAEHDVDAEAQGHNDVAIHDHSMAEAFGSESDDDGA